MSRVENLIRRLVLLLLLPLAAVVDLGSFELSEEDSERHETLQLKALIEQVVGDHPTQRSLPPPLLPPRNPCLPSVQAASLPRVVPALPPVLAPQPVYLELRARTLLRLPKSDDPPDALL